MPSGCSARGGRVAHRAPRPPAGADQGLVPSLCRERLERLAGRGRLGDDAVGELAEPFGQVPADHVPQQGAQVLGDLAGELLAVAAGVGRAEAQRALERDRLLDARGQLGGVLVGRAEGRQAPGEQPAAGSPPPPAARSARAGCRSAPRAATGALAGQLEAPQRPRRACRRRRPGARRGCRRRAARPPGRGSAAASRPWRVRPASCSARQAPPPVLTQPRASSAMRPSPNRRRARSSSASTPRAAWTARRGSSASQASSTNTGSPVSAREARPHVRQGPRKRLLAHDLEPVGERQLGRGDRQAAQPREHHHLAADRPGRGLQRGQRGLQPLGRELEVARLRRRCPPSAPAAPRAAVRGVPPRPARSRGRAGSGRARRSPRGRSPPGGGVGSCSRLSARSRRNSPTSGR